MATLVLHRDWIASERMDIAAVTYLLIPLITETPDLCVTLLLAFTEDR